MTTLDTLGTAHPAVDEVADAALAMADFDAKSGDYAMALDWLGVAAQRREITPEYTTKRAAWQTASAAPATSDSRRDAVAAAALTVIRRALIEGVRVTRQALEREASFHLAIPRGDAMRELDAVAQRLGVSALA
jgi:phage terminase large subunit-like protein